MYTLVRNRMHSWKDIRRPLSWCVDKKYHSYQSVLPERLKRETQKELRRDIGGVRVQKHRYLSTTSGLEYPKDAFFITTNPNFNDRKTIRELGFVVTSHVRTVNIFSDIWSAVSGVIGGETNAYTTLLNEASQLAMEKLAMEATELGANAITGVTFRHSTTMNRLIIGLHASVVVYGNAVVVEDNPPPETSR